MYNMTKINNANSLETFMHTNTINVFPLSTSNNLLFLGLRLYYVTYSQRLKSAGKIDLPKSIPFVLDEEKKDSQT